MATRAPKARAKAKSPAKAKRPANAKTSSTPSKKASRLSRAKNPMPAHVRSALTKRALMQKYKDRPDYQQNDYLGWIARAKLEATRLKRLAQMLDELEQGDVYMNMTWRPLRVRASS